MKKQWILLIVWILLLTGCTYYETVKKEPVQKEDSEVADTPKFTIAAMDYPPFESYEDGSFSGPGIAVVKEAFKRLDFDEDDYEIVEYPWSRILVLAEEGDVDMVLDISKTEERLQYLDFSEEPYVVYTVNLFARKTSAIEFDGDLNTMTSYTIGLVRDYLYSDNIIEARLRNPEMFEDASTSEDNIKKLIKGRVDLIAESKYNAKALLKASGYEDDVICLEPPVDVGTTYVAFPKNRGHGLLRDAYDEVIREMVEDGTVQSIYDAYFE